MMDLTPLDIRKKKADFARSIRGYEPAGVDQFLDLAADRLEEVVRENATLRERVAQLTETLTAYREREQAMNEALVSAQQLREEVRAQAAREAELVLREARMEGERILGEARRMEGEAVDSAKRVHAARSRFLRGFRSYLERQLEELEAEEERLRGEPREEGARAVTTTPEIPE